MARGSTAHFTFILDPTGVKRLASGPGVVGLVNRNAQRVADNARSTPGMPGWYRRSIAMHPATVGQWPVQAKVVSSSSFWHLLEFGSINNPPYRPLTTAVTRAGLEFQG